MAIRRLNRRPRTVPDWRSGSDRPFSGERFEWPESRQPAREYRRFGAPEYEHRRHRGAWGQPGPFTGMGPREYRPTDEQIYEQTCERLMRHGQVDARRIQVEVNDGEIRLHGTVSGPADRQMAEDALWSIPGVRDVKNMLRVEGERPPQARPAFRAHPPRGWKYKVEIFDTKRALHPAGEPGWTDEHSELTMLEAGLVPVTGEQEALADSPAWTIFTQADEAGASLDEREAGFEPGAKTAEVDHTGPPPASALTLTPGIEVVDREGLVLGRVKAVRADDFLLDRPLARDLYVPFSAVRSAEEHVVLTVRAEEVGQQGWEQPDVL
ncbi:MAG TPA: BON domain-containing protein [Anaerolineaceae bacterium]|nr:BON domain-containing protein [Anaerolineaceae bacterium]